MSDEKYGFEGITTLWKPPPDIGAVTLTLELDFFPEGEAGDAKRAELEESSGPSSEAPRNADGLIVGPATTRVGFADPQWGTAALAALVCLMEQDFEMDREEIRDALTGVLNSLDIIFDALT